MIINSHLKWTDSMNRILKGRQIMASTKLMQEVENVLKQFDSKYFVGDKVNKARVIEDVDNYNVDLMTAMLDNKRIKNNFTTKIAEHTVFKTNEFIEVFQADEYWEDSYTKYSKKIGLASNGNFLDEASETVLDFPYKDTVLKASMSKEDTDKEDLKPDEPFLNEVIAREEIDVLLDKKILKNAKKYTADGEEETSNFSYEDNLILKGNNLLGLHTLKDKYAGKVKLIYIDPPYNLKGDSFKYNDKFTKSTWLTFMKNRLEIAKELLTDDGSIWISISDEEMHYLKIIADEIFEEESFVGTLPRKTRDGKSDVPFNLSQDFDWLLVYTNGNVDDAIVGRQVDRKYYETDDFPGRPWRTADLTTQRTIHERPNSDFTMINPKTGTEYAVNPKRSWAVTKNTFQDYYNAGGIGFPEDYDFMSGKRPFRRIFKDEDEAKAKPSYISSDFLLKDFVSSLFKDVKNQKGNDQIDELFSRDEFDYAKPEELINLIVEATTSKNDIILDFFMGSATTQAVAHKMNRQYIGIEQMDYINTVSVPRLQKVIDGEQGGISEDVDWQGGGSFVYAELMEKNRGYLTDVMDASDQESLRDVFNLMLENADFDFRVDLEEVQDSLHTLSLEDQKRVLVKILDKNQLYYNYSEIDDANVRDLISDNDYQFNQSFYKEVNDE